MDPKKPAGQLTIMLTIAALNDGAVVYTKKIPLHAETIVLSENLELPLDLAVDEHGEVSLRDDDSDGQQPPRRVRTLSLEDTVTLKVDTHFTVDPPSEPTQALMTAKERWTRLLAELRSRSTDGPLT